MRIYALNSEFNQSSQTAWLNSDLEQHGAGIEWLLAAYHKPIRPHTRGKSEGDTRSGMWADTFYKYRFDLVAESDSHVSKYTYPIRPVQAGEQGDEGSFAMMPTAPFLSVRGVGQREHGQQMMTNPGLSPVVVSSRSN